MIDIRYTDTDKRKIFQFLRAWVRKQPLSSGDYLAVSSIHPSSNMRFNQKRNEKRQMSVNASAQVPGDSFVNILPPVDLESSCMIWWGVQLHKQCNLWLQTLSVSKIQDAEGLALPGGPAAFDGCNETNFGTGSRQYQSKVLF